MVPIERPRTFETVIEEPEIEVVEVVEIVESRCELVDEIVVVEEVVIVEEIDDDEETEATDVDVDDLFARIRAAPRKLPRLTRSSLKCPSPPSPCCRRACRRRGTGSSRQILLEEAADVEAG